MSLASPLSALWGWPHMQHNKQMVFTHIYVGSCVSFRLHVYYLQWQRCNNTTRTTVILVPPQPNWAPDHVNYVPCWFHLANGLMIINGSPCIRMGHSPTCQPSTWRARVCLFLWLAIFLWPVQHGWPYQQFKLLLAQLSSLLMHEGLLTLQKAWLQQGGAYMINN